MLPVTMLVFVTSPAHAMTDLNNNIPGEFSSKFEKIIEFSSSNSRLTCDACRSAIKLARRAALISKSLLPPLIRRLCTELGDGSFGDSTLCQQLPWDRQITSKLNRRTMMDKMMKRSWSDWAPWNQDDEDDNDEDEYGSSDSENSTFSSVAPGAYQGIDDNINNANNTDTSTSIRSSFLNDIYNVLRLMDPDSDDSTYFCYMFGFKACPLPQILEPDMSGWWPPRPANAKAPTPGGSTINVLHLSDVHLQRNYTVGAEGNCGTLMCCAPNSQHVPMARSGRDRSIVPADPFPAPPLGYYRCDTPELLLDSTLSDVVVRGKGLQKRMYYADLEDVDLEQGEDLFYTDPSGRELRSRPLAPRAEDGLGFEFAIFTGDMIDHDPLTISYEDSVWEEEQSLRKFKQYLGGIPVYPVLGNHDTYPYGQVAQERSGYANLFTWNSNLMADLWSEFGWLGSGPDADAAIDSVRRHYGAYAVTTRGGLRVISLNSNFWYMWNMYNYWNTSDPDTSGILRFLSDELVACEKKGQYAWIIAHVPPGGIDTDAMPVSASAFSQIIQRFSPHVITGVFFGHTHRDEFQLVYAGDVTRHFEDDGPGRTPVNVAWIAQSITPLTNYNPGWRYYKVDSQTFQVMDSLNFYTRLNDTFDANSHEHGSRTTDWHALYSARDEYAPDDWPANKPLDAQFWEIVAHRIRDEKGRAADGDDSSEEADVRWRDSGFAQKYTNFGYRMSPHTPRCVSDKCRATNFCYVTSITPLQVKSCKQRYGLA
ncbi:uncharacterized protein SAPINGB_P002979 [Magnusiomyces paraingens]|uniref:Calcineurin-like phosphoesterase domain-containing protein n=1 Tax=Magnusiomyces paraingens TaxID=2606893 RepID=A0A5E8BHD4_9ASCO|nr:uncharacterized protein SAPINGB_P002979 [Saprochaete ingens]VVT51086.1 unnamed protein product [Saprochaete ingens]